MEDYIKRETVIAFLENMAASRYLIQCFQDKEKFPAENVKPEQHGKWIEHHGQSYLVHPMKYDEYGPMLQDYVGYKCSECGRTESEKEPYCNCGAKMDGGNK